MQCSSVFCNLRVVKLLSPWFGKTRDCGCICQEVPWLIPCFPWVWSSIAHPDPPSGCLPSCSTAGAARVQQAGWQCLRFLEQRLLRKCQHSFIALRNFVISVLKGGPDNHLFCRETSGVSLCSCQCCWLDSFSESMELQQPEKKAGRGDSHARGLEREELNSQTTLHLLVAVWEQELPLMPVFYLLTDSC